MDALSHLSDDALLLGLHQLVGSQRRVTAQIVAHLGEVENRRLHAKRGFSSLFGYCVEELHFSEDEACRRIDAARLGRRFPLILESLADGSVSLTVLSVLKPRFTSDNHARLLAGVANLSVRDAKEWLAAQFPSPDVPTTIGKLPMASGASAAQAVPVTATSTRSLVEHMAVTPPLVGPTADTPRVDAPRLGHSHSSLRRRARVEPLSQDRFLIKLTVSREMKDKLELARDLMRHANPAGDLGVVLERALDALVKELEASKLGKTRRPQRGARAARSERVTNATRRTVVDRDGLRCAFVSTAGRRCGERAFLEFDHERPRGLGGGSDPLNVRLLCRAHNQLEAEDVYGAEFMERARERRCASKRGVGT